MCLNPPSETVILSVGWAWGPPKVMKNASVRQPLSMEPLPFPCHPDRSEAERRDLRFYGPVLEMFFDGAKRLADYCVIQRLSAESKELEGRLSYHDGWNLSISAVLTLP